MSKIITEEEVAQHNTSSDCWLIIGEEKDGKPDEKARVYDVTKYLGDHPGGSEIMMEFAGKDANTMFEDIGHSAQARIELSKYLIGELKVDPNAPKKVKAVVESKKGLPVSALIILIIAMAAGYYYSQIYSKM